MTSDIKRPMVSVFMITYNHEKYIVQAVESVLKQKTLFTIEIIIGDDCSTDNTRKILLKYADKFPGKFRLILHEKNIGHAQNTYLTMLACTGKYTALCEGDDYWTDPSKLQKQVDFLETNSDYGMVHSDCDYYYQGQSKRIKNINKFLNRSMPSGYIFENLLIGNFIVTPTVCVRTDLIKNYFSKTLETNFKMGDYPGWLEISKWTKIGYLNNSLAVYRVSEGTASRPKEIQKKYEFEESAFNIKRYFIDKYGCANITRETIAINYKEMELKFAFLFNNKQKAKIFYNYLVDNQKCKKLHPDLFMYYWGTQNVITRLISECYFNIVKYKRRIIPVTFYKSEVHL